MDSLQRLRLPQDPGPSSDLSPLDQGDTDSNFSSIRRILYKYDVFISCVGRHDFTDRLYNHLIGEGILVFNDDKELEEGQPVSPQLVQAIKESRVSIIVFSKDYAFSTWCLEDMATIADCKNDLNQTVFTVFYDVHPSVVRKQIGLYHTAFLLHRMKFKEDPGKVDRWKRAMTGLANSVGWDGRNKLESIEIEKIVPPVYLATS